MTNRVRPAILVLSQLPPPVHGSTVMTRHLVEALGSIGFRVAVVERRFSRTADAVGRPSLDKALAAPALALRLALGAVRTRPLACVFFLTNRPGSFLVDVVLLTVLRALGVPVLLYVHTMGYRQLARRSAVWGALVRSALGRGDLVTLGDALLDDVRPLTRRPVHVVANTTTPQPDGEERPLDAPLRITFLSNLQPEKGPEVFARMAGRLASGVGRDWRFTVAGSGDAARVLEVRTAARAAGGAVEVIGAVDETAKWALLRDTDVLVFPSAYQYEAQPLTVVEAMSAGVPVVAWDTGGLRDLVVDGQTGRLVAQGDEDGLVAALADLADPAERARLGAGGLRRFQERHSAASYRAAWARLLPMPDAPIDQDDGFAGSAAAFRRLVAADGRANPRDIKAKAVLLGFRLAQWAMQDPQHPRPLGLLVVAAYRYWTEFGIGLELRPKTRVGGGLTIYHGYGLVVNDHARLGARVIVRNNVTIGQRTPGGACPVIEDGAELGAGAIILGGIRIGRGASIGAGSVVLRDVPDGASAVGNPARILSEHP